jgi:hypothetical protein
MEKQVLSLGGVVRTRGKGEDMGKEKEGEYMKNT